MPAKTAEIAAKKGSILQKYNNTDATKHAGYAAMKMGVDAGGAAGGALLGAGLGIFAPYFGVALFWLGHFQGDKTGLIRIAGAACFGYGIAKAIENRNSTKAATLQGITMGSLAGGAKERLINYKDNIIQAFFIDKLTGGKTEVPVQGFGSLDLSELDVFENINKESAVNFEMQKAKAELRGIIQSDELENMDGLNYAVIQEEVDLTNI